MQLELLQIAERVDRYHGSSSDSEGTQWWRLTTDSAGDEVLHVVLNSSDEIDVTLLNGFQMYSIIVRTYAADHGLDREYYVATVATDQPSIAFAVIREILLVQATADQEVFDLGLIEEYECRPAGMGCPSCGAPQVFREVLHAHDCKILAAMKRQTKREA